MAAARCTPDSASPPPPPPAARRRELLLRSVALPQLLLLAEVFVGDGGTDGRTIVNSILGAYGLPQFKAKKGFRTYDELEDPFTFQYPQSWVGRRNTLRSGVYISDFNTADKLSVEVFQDPAVAAGSPPGSSTPQQLAEAAVLKLVNPAAQNAGDGKLDMPPASKIKTEEREVDGRVYTFIAFPSETITRSGYQVRRKNLAVAATRRGTAYVLGCSARSDQYDKGKEATFLAVVDSFRLLGTD
ncbi:psbP chloroplastic isoform X1 [Micractinium conductrix]|uniref:PsbP chloroplastic isoform X1 n=1 Tax=Micractinium conductrix TaxID=554055 RepID=A0A2P6VKK6_9CHLO|nr:psbP chloroplastic isoform X1 [Micractinium conductrix]|eukprot:PSC74590.1 psbP chloroplastic isoform X1 [Micractinium conductrix]